jgi:hypothetical protein
MWRAGIALHLLLLPSLSSAADSEPYGLFYNATRYEIVVEFYRTHGAIYAKMFVGPQSCNEIQLMQGTAIVTALRGTGPVWKRALRKGLARVQLVLPQSENESLFSWTHPSHRSADYRISAGKIELLSPAEGKRLCP